MRINSSFNARNATPQQIAETFVVPEYFEQVAAFNNLVLVGPRGLGKTTIMKALTASGLRFLHQRPDLKEFLSRIDFSYIPIYVPAESIWRGNAQSITGALGEEHERDHVLNGLFVDHCLHQLVTSFEDAIFHSELGQPAEHFPWMISLSESDEKLICNECSVFWGLPRVQNSFVGLKLSLLQRSNEYRASISSLPDRTALDQVLSYQKYDFLLMLKGFFDVVGSIREGIRWSVCFDEMEIAPKRVLAQLYENLRSFDQRAVLKFSLFPYIDFYSLEQRQSASERGPVDGQDFHTVILANKFANPDYTLARRLISNECTAAGTSLGEFSAYLNGSSSIHKGTRKFTDRGVERNYVAIHAMAAQAGDKSYIDYMKQNGILKAGDLDAVKGEKKRAQLIRKTAPITEIRSYYLVKGGKNAGSSSRRASSKGFGYYHGFDQILSLTEGNPRAIKYYVTDLLRSFDRGENSAVAQNRAISRNVDRFRALVSAHTFSIKTVNEQTHAPLQLVDILGDALSEVLLGPQFQPEPALSYEVKGLNSKLNDALVLAINSGALIVDQTSGGKQLIFDLEGCRFRLSHRLAPFYKLPTITGQPRKLSGLPRTTGTYDNQPDLLSWAKNDV
ncbi:ORC-CDC6 family AAA ATPase [Ruegeria arenilitoris]|uniref:ORC-CDC6 family AAA ATPase n=1 Tax=Ruegeria arenilitoris TaxID=1173585 RepID=UPI00147F0F0C|nr:hypothetical protein [Ruegeria arenilitoris]